MSTLKVGAIRGVSASSDAITVANDGTASAKLTSINNGQLSGFRNLLINGEMQVNQRITDHGVANSFNPVTGSIYTLDRWIVANKNSFDTDSAKVLKDTDSPNNFASSMKWDIGNTETPNNNQFCGIEQKIEAQNLVGLGYGTSSAKSITLSFHVKSNKTGTYCVQLMTQGSTNEYLLSEYTISSQNTWEKKTITFIGNVPNPLNNDNGAGLRIIWALTSGSDQHAAATTSWVSSTSFHATSNQVNLWDNASNNWYMTGCQLEVGEAATEYEHRSFGHELQLCQRYFYKIIGTSDDIAGFGFTTSSSDNFFNIQFPVPMRDYPTYTGSATPARFLSSNNGQDFNLNAMAINSNTTHTNPSRVTLYVSQAGTAGGLGGALHIQNQEGFLEFSAEL